MNKVFSRDMDSRLICPIILLFIGSLWCGGYYEYSSAILGVLAAVMVWVNGKKEKRELPCDNYLLFAGCLTFFYLLVVPVATDSGMAFTGVVKKSTFLLFALLLSTLTVEQRRWMLHRLPEMAVLTAAIGGLCALFPITRPYVVAAGRFCGTFGYANTYAVFLLLALLVLVETFVDRKGWWKFVMGGILFLALWFTGSRYTWLLTGFMMFVYAVRNKKNRKIAICILGILIVATLTAAIFFRQSEAMGRFFTTNLSTFWGRLLYWQDAWHLIQKHGFGMGYLGYYYEQTQVQTGMYTVRFVHNDLLQWLLDLGWLPMLLLLLLVGYGLFSKKRPKGEKGLLLALILHSCLEFDLEHTAVAFLWILVLSCTEESVLSVRKSKHDMKAPMWVRKSMALILGGLCLYMAVPLCLYAGGNSRKAVAWYPLYTDARLALLSEERNPDEAEKMADRILKQNDTVFLAYDAKAQVAFQNHEFEAMMYNKRCAIERNKYDANEYIYYLNMLNEALLDSQKQSDAVLQDRIITEMEQLPDLIRSKEATVSPLGKKIDDQVDIALPDEIVVQIQNLRDNN